MRNTANTIGVSVATMMILVLAGCGGGVTTGLETGEGGGVGEGHAAGQETLVANPGPAIVESQESDTQHADHTSRGDGTIVGDGDPDAVLETDLDARAVALTLLTTDAEGKPQGGQQWDTLVGGDAIASVANGGFAQGAQTWQLGVATSDGIALNDADGRLKPGFGGRHVRLYASNSGYFRRGTYFRLFVTLSNGTILASPTHAYEGSDLGPFAIDTGNRND